MTAKKYRELLKHPLWQKKRLEILTRDNWCCFYCGDTESTLHVHHECYIGENPWDTPEECLTTLCESCHQVFYKLNPLESFLTQCLLSQGKIKGESLEYFELTKKVINNFKKERAL